MKNEFRKIADAKALDELIERSKRQPVIIFKHSTTCPISSSAYRQMSAFDGDVNLIDVQASRELSLEIEKRTGVRHESPQVLILQNGQVLWYASHWKVRADSIAEALRHISTRNT